MRRSKIQPDDAILNADAIRRAEVLLSERERPPAAMVADLCALFSELARIKRERDEREAWWQAVLDKPVSPGRSAPRGFAHKDGDYEGPMAHKLGEETLDVVRTVCSRCGRTGAHRLSELLHRYGPQQSMPGLLQALAADCPRRGNYSDMCQLRFVDPIGARGP